MVASLFPAAATTATGWDTVATVALPATAAATTGPARIPMLVEHP